MPTAVTIRMYNQQSLGDCFLLRFQDGGHESFMLIDFGSYVSGNEEREIEIAESIVETVGDSPLTIVITHQHKDHLTGFLTAATQMAQLNIKALWLSYLDDPNGKEARAMRKLTEQFWKKNAESKKKVRDKFGADPMVKRMLEAKEAHDHFAFHQEWGKAIELLVKWSATRPRYLLPGDSFDLPHLPAERVKVYVLGPPTDEQLLRKMHPSKGDAVQGLGLMSGLMNLDTSATLMLDALHAVTEGKDSTETENFPFNKRFAYPLNDPFKTIWLRREYEEPKQSWRRIDHEWLSEMGRISLHMGNLTNNSSLVLAFELVEQKKVLLFVGDAQIGNWRSWAGVRFEASDVDATDLLTRTVLYKAGHHSSHNATLAESLDLMNEEELVIMIPVNEEVASRMGFRMLDTGMLKGYNRKCRGRVLRSDTIFHKAGSSRPFLHPFAAKRTDFKPAIKVGKDRSGKNHLFVEHTVR